jgi:AcrR family transcriptional regulator
LVGINEIIEKASVAKATFYAHFKSKEKLCAEWLRSEAIRSEEAGSQLLQGSLTAVEKLSLKFEGLRGYCSASDFRGCPFSITASMTLPSSEVRDIIRDYKAGSRVFWQTLAHEFQSDPALARDLGDALFLLYAGATSEAQNARDSWPVDAALKAALKLATGESSAIKC